MKSKILYGFIVLFVLSCFSLISITKNIYIKFNEYEFVTYLFDKNREENFNILLKKDIENKLNIPIKITIGKDLVFFESIKNIGNIQVLNKDTFSFTLKNTLSFLREFYFSDSGYLISLKYQLVLDKNKLNKVLQNKINSLEKESFKRYFIKDYTIDSVYGLIGVESNFPNINLEAIEKNKFETQIDLSTVDLKLLFTQEDLDSLEIKIPAINKADLFEEQHQSKIQNIKSSISIKVGNLNYNYLYLQDISIFVKQITKDDLMNYLSIIDNGKLFVFNDLFFTNISTIIKQYIEDSNYLLEYFVSPLKYPDTINEKYKISIKKIDFFNLEKLHIELKKKVQGMSIFENTTFFSEQNTSIKEKYFSYKTDYTIKLEKTNERDLVCSTFDGIQNGNNIKKRLYYVIQQKNNFSNVLQLSDYINQNQTLLNTQLDLITQVLLEHSLLIQNKKSTEIYSFLKENTIFGPLKTLKFNFFDQNNILIVNSDSDFMGLCNYDEQQQVYVFTVLSNKKKQNQIVFGPVKKKNLEKWTIEVNGSLITPIIYK